jgi:gas vesicle protein
VNHLERVASIVGTILIGTAAYLILSDRLGNESRRMPKRREQEPPVEELAEGLKQAWSGYHNR